MSLHWALGFAGVPELPCLWRPLVSLKSIAISCISILGGGETTRLSFPGGTLVWMSLTLVPSTSCLWTGRAAGGGTASPRRILQRQEREMWLFFFPSQISSSRPIKSCWSYGLLHKKVAMLRHIINIHQSYDSHRHIHAFKPTCKELKKKPRINHNRLFAGTAISHCKCRTVPDTVTTVAPVSRVSFCTNYWVSGQMWWCLKSPTGSLCHGSWLWKLGLDLNLLWITFSVLLLSKLIYCSLIKMMIHSGYLRMRECSFKSVLSSDTL